MGVILSRRVTRPLDGLARSMKAFGEGNADAGISVSSGGLEVKQLADSFNRMIADRRRSETELRETEQRFRELFDRAADALFLHDREGRIVDANKQACESLGYTYREILDLSVSDVAMDLDREALKRTWAGLAPGAPLTLEGVHRRKDGTTFPVEVRLGLFEWGGHPLVLALAMPFYMLRPQRSARMLSESGKLSLDDVVRLKHSTRMELADRVLPDLLAARSPRRRRGKIRRRGAAGLGSLRGRRQSRGIAVVPLDAGDGRESIRDTVGPGQSPDDAGGAEGPGYGRGRAAERRCRGPGAVREPRRALRSEYFRFRRDGLHLPGNGPVEDFGAFRTVHYEEAGKDGRRAANGGDTYVAVVEFSNPVRAKVLLGYGNASLKGSAHRTDQLEFMSKKTLRDAWRTREEIEPHLEAREMLSVPPLRVESH